MIDPRRGHWAHGGNGEHRHALTAGHITSLPDLALGRKRKVNS